MEETHPQAILQKNSNHNNPGITVKSSLPLQMLESASHSVMSISLRPHRLYSPWNSLGQNTGVGSRPLLQGIFPTQGLNPGLPHCRWILYQLSHQGSPRILKWIAYLFSSGSSWPRIDPGSPALQTDSLLAELPGKPLRCLVDMSKELIFIIYFPSL